MSDARARFALLAVICGCCLLLQACDSCELYGPVWVRIGQIATYVVDMEPYYSHANATVFVVVEVPESWGDEDWSYTGTIGGEPVEGSGSFVEGDPGNCSKPPLPTGKRRVYAEAGVFSDLQPDRDQVNAELNFAVGGATGPHRLTVWVEAVDDAGVQCAGMEPLDLIVYQWRTLEWTQVVGTGSPHPPGLGGRQGFMRGRAAFDGHFYLVFDPDIGPYPDGFGSEIWRSSDLASWELVRPAQEGEGGGTLVTLNGRLLLVTGRDLPGVPGGQYELWSTEDGFEWTLLTTWIDWPYVVVTNDATIAVVLRRGDIVDSDYFLTTSSDGVEWTMVGDGPFADESQPVVSGEFLGSDLYLGGSFEDANEVRRPRIWRYDGVVLEVVDSSPVGDSSRWVTAMESSADQLFVGVAADGGGEIWSYDGVGAWQQVADNGIAMPGDSIIRALVYRQSLLFALVIRDDESQIRYAGDDFIWSRSRLDDGTAGSQIRWISAFGDELVADVEYELWRRVLLFEDGFESGSTSRWSDTGG